MDRSFLISRIFISFRNRVEHCWDNRFVSNKLEKHSYHIKCLRIIYVVWLTVIFGKCRDYQLHSTCTTRYCTHTHTHRIFDLLAECVVVLRKVQCEGIFPLRSTDANFKCKREKTRKRLNTTGHYTQPIGWCFYFYIIHVDKLNELIRFDRGIFG